MSIQIDWERLLSMAPLAFAKPGSPESMAFMQGQQESHERMRRDEERQRQAEERQREIWLREQQAQAQAQNLEAGNRRQDERLELERLQAYTRPDTAMLGALQEKPEIVLDETATPLSAQNDLTVRRLQQQQQIGVPPGTPQGPLPNMTQAVSNRDKRLAQRVLEETVKNPLYAGYIGKPELDEMTVQFKDGSIKKIRELRALVGGMLLGPDGTPMPPMGDRARCSGRRSVPRYREIDAVEADSRQSAQEPKAIAGG